MRNARGKVAAAIAAWFADVPGGDPDEWPIVSETSTAPTDPPTRRTVIVAPATVDPPSVACPSARTYGCAVYVFSPMTAGAAADNDVDDLVDGVLDALDAVGLAWSDVRRGTFLDAYPSYTLTAEVPQ